MFGHPAVGGWSARGESLGGDYLGGCPMAQCRACRAPRHFDGPTPEALHTSWTGEAEAQFIFRVVGFERAVRLADVCLERAHGASASERQPVLLGVGGGDDHEEAELGPRYFPALECCRDLRQRRCALGDRGKALKLAPRETQPLARVVVQSGEAQRVLPTPAEK